MNRRG